MAEKILVVDDELNMRLVLKALLNKEGYDVPQHRTVSRP